VKVSIQAIKYLNEHYGSAGDPASDGVDALVARIGAQLGAVEETVPFGERFKGVVVVKVVQVTDHPDADRLHVCKVDAGKAAPDVERDSDGLVQVVCGAPNVHEGMLAAWIPPGATVPSTYGTQEPFVINARPFRGVLSNGMMASPKELALGDSHEGLLEIDEELGPIAPGTLFADAFHITDDVILDIENKMFTHRPDCFGWLGIAREIEGIQQRPYKSPEWYAPQPPFPTKEADELKLTVRNELPELVPRFVAVALRDVQVKPSPVWLQVDLARAGLRPINNIVDYTNWYMLLTGQPLHAYDYDKVAAISGGDGATIVVRHPNDGEKILLLNGKEIMPRDEAIMIATDQQLIGVGGVMGGGDTEVSGETRNIIIEAATFDMYSIRRTSMAHGLFTDAVTRFNKGQSPLQNLAVAAKIVDEIRGHAGGKVACDLIDDNRLPEDAKQRASVHPPVTVSRRFVNERLGIDLSVDQMRQLLENVECKLEVQGDDLAVTAPFWRTDIEIPEDIVEEVGRLYGFDHLPQDLPQRSLTPAPKNNLLALKAEVRRILAAAGANEVLGYSFVHGNLLDKVGQDNQQAFQLGNAISPDLQYFRLSLSPSLLDAVHPNIKAGYDEFAIFELGKAHNIKELDGDGLPREVNALGFVYAANAKAAAARAGAPYYQARTCLMHLLAHFGVVVEVRLEPLEGADLYNNPWIEQMCAPFAPARSAVLRDGQGLIWGVVGEYKPGVRRALKLPDYVAGFELDPLLFFMGNQTNYVALPRFPKIEQDICLKVPADTAYAQVFDFVWNELASRRPEGTLPSLGPVDIYQRDDDAEHKQITLRVSLASYERTLTDQEIARMLDDIAAAARPAINAERV
jgi:phenylalanyl-tRNA synthetase beta chain